MHEMQKFNSVDELVNIIRPVDPIYCIRPNSIKLACSWFKSNFPGKILYAVKTNPNEKVIRRIGESGIERFDVASINEIKLIRKIFPEARAYYMNAVKSREHIQEAYFNYNIRDFALDTKEELQKIIEGTFERFNKYNIVRNRLILLGESVTRKGLLEVYNEIDIALDPFPFQGNTSTIEATWMGVTVITLKGQRYLSHFGESINSNLNMHDWIAKDHDEYISKAIKFSSDFKNLSKIKPNLIGSISVIDRHHATREPAPDPRPGPTGIFLLFAHLI